MNWRSPVTVVHGLRVRIRVGGLLRANWSVWFEGPSVGPLEGGGSCLSGTLADQAALPGMLARIRDLGLPLLGLEVAETVGTADLAGALSDPAGKYSEEVRPALTGCDRKER